MEKDTPSKRRKIIDKALLQYGIVESQVDGWMSRLMHSKYTAAILIMLCLLGLWLWMSPAQADEFRLNIYGLSYHPDRATVKKYHVDNQTNPGLALNYTFSNGLFAEIGAYEDSGYSQANFLSAGYYHRFGRFRAGGALVLLDSDTYNNGRPFVAPIPSVAVDVGRVRLHAVYFPKVSGFSRIEAYGVYLSVPVGGGLR